MSNLARFSQGIKDGAEHMKKKLIIIQEANIEKDKKKTEISQKRQIAHTNCNMPIKAGYIELICKNDLQPGCLTVEDYITTKIREDEQYFRRQKYVRVEMVSNEDYAHILRKHIESQGGIEDENCMLLDDWMNAKDKAKNTKLYKKDGQLYTAQDYMNLNKK